MINYTHFSHAATTYASTNKQPKQKSPLPSRETANRDNQIPNTQPRS